MAVGLEFSFLAERYHATPWGHHVNEGLVEWPPCPWRILRSLIAVGFNKLAWTEVPELGNSLLEKLAALPPTYLAPQVLVTHSRHYMPDPKMKNKKKEEIKTSLVFDSWAKPFAGPRGLQRSSQGKTSWPLQVLWDVELVEAERQLLEDLAHRLTYLGRAESWVEAKVIDALSADANVIPLKIEDSDPGQSLNDNWQVLQLQSPTSPKQFARWRDESLKKALAPLQPEPGKKLSAKLKKAQQKEKEKFPLSIVNALMTDNINWQKDSWNRPPGSKSLIYQRQQNLLQSFAVAKTKASEYRRELANANFVLFSIATESRRKSGLPQETEAFMVAREFHRRIAGIVKARTKDGQCDDGFSLLIGKDLTSRQALQGHRHCHIIPLALTSAQKIDHIAVYCPAGLNFQSLKLLNSISKMAIKKTGMRYHLSCIGSGSDSIFDSLRPKVRDRLRQFVPREQKQSKSQIWETARPFVCARFVKTYGKNTLVGQIEHELRWRNLPTAEILNLGEDGLPTMPSDCEFRKVRISLGKKRPKQYWPMFLQLKFEEAISGPLTLGYGSHFGLGLFRHVEQVS